MTEIENIKEAVCMLLILFN